MQAKVFLHHLLATNSISLAPEAKRDDFAMFPIPRPRDGMPVRLERLG